MNQVKHEINDRLDELIRQWEESLMNGVRLSPAELCRECPEMVVELERALSCLETLDQLIYPERHAVAEGETPASTSGVTQSLFPSVPGYQVLAEIGRGGMGVVYKAKQTSLKRDVAIKTLSGSHWGNSSYVARLRREADGLSRLNHPNVVKIIDVVESPFAVWIILEYIEGGTLESRLKQSAMRSNEAAGMALELASTMAFVHQKGLLHRDLKPANILIDLKGTMKVVDFGLVKEDGNFNGLTGTGDFFGTPSYMAPEQIAGRLGLVDVRSDVYGIGAILYQMLCGRPPFVGVSTLDTLDQVQHRDPVPLRVLNPGIPRDLETICLKCLEKEPARRFASAQELTRELQRFQDGVPIQSRPTGLFERGRRWCRRNPAVAGLWGLSLAASVAIMGLLFANNRNLVAYNRDLDKAAKIANKHQDDAEQSEQKTKAALVRVQDALHEAKEALHKRNEAYYVSAMNRAAAAAGHNDSRELVSLLEQHIPAPGEPDLRGFEWWHHYRRAKGAGKTLLDLGSPQYKLSRIEGREEWAVAGADSIVRIFNHETGEVIQQVPTGQIEVNDVAFAFDRQEMATAGDDGTIKTWDMATWRQRRTIADAHPGKVFQLEYTEDGSKIISCGDNPVVRVHDAQTGELAFTLEGHRDAVQSIFLFWDGKTLYSASNDSTVKFWSLENQKLIWSFGSSGKVSVVVPRGMGNQVIYSNEKGELTVVNSASKHEITSLKQIDKIGALAFRHPNKNPLAIGDRSGQIRVRNMTPQGEFTEDKFPDWDAQAWHAHQGMVYSLVWSPDAESLISTGDDGRVIRWDWNAMKVTYPKEIEIQMGSGFRVEPSTTSLLVFGYTDSQSPAVLNRVDWKLGSIETERTEEVVADSVPVNQVPFAISPDGNLLTTVFMQGSHKDFDRSDELHVYRLPEKSDRAFRKQVVAKWAPKQGELQNVRFSPDLKSIAVSKWYQRADSEVEDHAVWLLELPTLERARRIPVDFARDSAFAPNGQRMVLVTQKGLVLWDIAKDEVVWNVPNTFIGEVVYSPDGSLVATFGSNRMVQVINASDGSTRFQSTNHRGAIHTIAFSPDGRLLVTGAEDGIIKFWHVSSGQELMELNCPGDRVQHVAFSGDGEQLICQVFPQGGGGIDRLLVFDGSQFHR